MGVVDFFRARFGRAKPTYDAAGHGRRTLAWWVGNPGPADALTDTLDQLRAKSRDQVRRNAWAAAGVEAFVANAVGTGIKPQSLVDDAEIRKQVQVLWWEWTDEADSSGLTCFTYEMLTGDLTQVNYSSIRAGLLEFRRRCEAIQHGVIVHQFCRPVWNAWMDQAVLSGNLELPGYAADRRRWRAVKWIPQGWQWVDPQKEFDAVVLPEEVQGLRAFGSETEIESIAGVLARHLETMRNKHAITLEHLRMGALKGEILDADGTTLVDLYTEFGIAPKTVSFALATANTNVKGKCLSVLRHIEDNLLGEYMTRVHCLCSPEFFDQLTSHPKVEAAYARWQEGAALINDTRAGFTFGGITSSSFIPIRCVAWPPR